MVVLVDKDNEQQSVVYKQYVHDDHQLVSVWYVEMDHNWLDIEITDVHEQQYLDDEHAVDDDSHLHLSKEIEEMYFNYEKRLPVAGGSRVVLIRCSARFV